MNKSEGEVKTFKNYHPEIDEEGLDLIKKMLNLNPYLRISASQALEHVRILIKSIT